MLSKAVRSIPISAEAGDCDIAVQGATVVFRLAGCREKKSRPSTRTDSAFRSGLRVSITGSCEFILTGFSLAGTNFPFPGMALADRVREILPD